MKELIIYQNRITKDLYKSLLKICPFNAIEINNDEVQINSACRFCGICVKQGPEGVFEIIEKEIINKKIADKSQWKGVAVYIEQFEGRAHPVCCELIGKARELAGKINQNVYALCIGEKAEENAALALEYGVDEVYLYEGIEYKYFRIEPYAAAFEDFINKVKPSVCLVGGTATGRSLAPRLAARFRTGLTADCTSLDINENTDLEQIRPAYGENIMAHIHTPEQRPQFATVRYKIFSAPEKIHESGKLGKIIKCYVPLEKLNSKIKVLGIKDKKKDIGIEEAEIIVVAGRGVKKKEDLGIITKLADILGGQTACTRSLIESGWFDAKKQIGLSGRTVKPKLIITCGVSGAIQFTAGMNSSQTIVAINSDSEAPIMKIAHYGIVGNIYEIIPLLIKKIESANMCGNI